MLGGGGGGLIAKSCLTLQPRGLSPIRLLCPWDFPGKNTGVGCHSLLQEIFLTQDLNLGLLHCRQSLTVWAPREAPSCSLRTFKANHAKSMGAGFWGSTAADSTSLRGWHWCLKCTMGITESIVFPTPAPWRVLLLPCYLASERAPAPLLCSSQVHPLTDSSAHTVAEPLQSHWTIALKSTSHHYLCPATALSFYSSFLKKNYLFIWLYWFLVVALGIFDLWSSLQHAESLLSMQTLSCGTWDLVLWPGIESRPPALGAQSLNHWTTREVPQSSVILWY